MDDISLIPEPFLGGYARVFGDTKLVEVTDMALMSIAQPLNGRAALQKAVKTLWGCSLPAPGKSEMSKDGDTRLLCLGPDSFLALGNDAPGKARGKLQGGAYTTDQSDNWVILRLTGPLTLTALERICPIDLHSLETGDFARTAMEHLGVIVLRQDDEGFLLLSASSSAGSFLHALETSIANVSG